jgi:hypothetical protein
VTTDLRYLAFLGIPYLRTVIFALGYVAVAGLFWEFIK